MPHRLYDQLCKELTAHAAKSNALESENEALKRENEALKRETQALRHVVSRVETEAAAGRQAAAAASTEANRLGSLLEEAAAARADDDEALIEQMQTQVDALQARINSLMAQMAEGYCARLIGALQHRGGEEDLAQLEHIAPLPDLADCTTLSRFLQLYGGGGALLEKHQLLKERGDVVEWTPALGGEVIFVSHEASPQ